MTNWAEIYSQLYSEIGFLCEVVDSQWISSLCVLGVLVLMMVYDCTPRAQHNRLLSFSIWLLQVLLVLTLVGDVVDVILMVLFPVEFRWACKNNRSALVEAVL